MFFDATLSTYVHVTPDLGDCGEVVTDKLNYRKLHTRLDRLPLPDSRLLRSLTVCLFQFDPHNTLL